MESSISSRMQAMKIEIPLRSNPWLSVFMRHQTDMNVNNKTFESI